jgi:hypothetical protein
MRVLGGATWKRVPFLVLRVHISLTGLGFGHIMKEFRSRRIVGWRLCLGVITRVRQEYLRRAWERHFQAQAAIAYHDARERENRCLVPEGMRSLACIWVCS